MQDSPRDRVAAIVNNHELAGEVIRALGRIISPGPLDESAAADWFVALVREIALTAATHPRREDLFALLREDWDQPKEVLAARLDFVRSQLISKLKGLLAEILAIPCCEAVAAAWIQRGRLPRCARFWAGFSLRERERSGKTWKKGADGLFCSDDDGNLTIYGIVEIKSYRTTLANVLPQLALHLSRLRWGLEVAGHELPPDCVFVAVRSDEDWTRYPVSELPEALPSFPRVLVSPRLLRQADEPSEEISEVPGYHARLEIPERFLSKAAYHMTWWVVADLGPQIYGSGVVNPGNAAVDALTQSLYYMGMRDLPARARSIATDLYNVLGFGFDAAKENSDHAEILWAESASPTDAAFDAYRRGQLEEALVAIETGLGSTLDDADRSQLLWLRGMVHYFGGRLERAAEVFHTRSGPPLEAADDHLVLALILARAGRLEEAAIHVEGVVPADQRYDRVLVRGEIARAFISARGGDVERARVHAGRAKDALQKRCCDIRKRLKKGLGVDEPFRLTEVDVSCLAVQTAAVYAALGDAGAAAALVQLVGPAVLTPYLVLLGTDAVFESVRGDAQHGKEFRGWVEKLVARDQEYWRTRDGSSTQS
jgi:hypothetical protein